MEDCTKNTRSESALIGSMEVPAEALYGVQTLRGIENFPISSFHLNDYPLFINGLAVTKLAAAQANHQLGLLTDEQFNAISQPCREILEGKHNRASVENYLRETALSIRDFIRDFVRKEGIKQVYFTASIDENTPEAPSVCDFEELSQKIDCLVKFSN